MDVQQFFKRDHVKMSSLFDKLADTSDNALKTRERLFDELRNEIAAHRTIVEDRLYPLLSKHKETRGLKPTARELNQLDRQLSRVEALDKDDPTFLPKVRELKKTTENHLREEERHIVPALKKALEPEEFQELARELVEGKREEREEARQRNGGGAESGGSRNTGSQENPGTAESSDQLGTQPVVHQLSEARRAGARLVFEEQRRASEAVEAIGRASADVAPQLGMLPLQRTASGSRNVASTARELHQALADTVAEGLRVNTEACLDALRCTTLPELSRLHGRLLAQWMRLNSDMGSRVVRATQRAFLGGFTSDADRMGRR